MYFTLPATCLFPHLHQQGLKDKHFAGHQYAALGVSVAMGFDIGMAHRGLLPVKMIAG